MPAIPYTIPLPVKELIPCSDLVSFNSMLHGRSHIARVMVHALRLIQTTGHLHLEKPLWAGVYLHDIARRHDGSCSMHGEWAIAKWHMNGDIQDMLDAVGVEAADYPVIETAVIHHCRPEILPDNPHYTLTALLKDADGLDRVRLQDLDTKMLRNPESLLMVDFADRLYQKTARLDHYDPDLMEWVWEVAARL